ncbi:MAG TPA: thiamine pyrophosphate-dependent dehydrogenase E1 component subunit alpha [Polyangiaceae bacterium]|nr:thiamine pyrophosphate-dependent dehydrogenase E1 component subunit alpha [Polyangiaceae bacterium]
MTLAAVIPTKHTRNPNDVLAPGVIRVMRDDGTTDPAHDPRLADEELVSLYASMVRVRVLDDRMVSLQRQGRIGFHIGSIGEEASILGSTFAMRKGDWVFPCYREFGAALLRGLTLQRYVDNMFGNANDTVKGRQMPDHYTSRESHFLSISSPVGTQISQAVGLSWAAKLRHDDAAAIVYFGDGATSSNDFHNAMNFAGVFKTPTIFFCRNNGWAISVPTERQTASASFAEKGIAYGVPSLRCDGNDLLAVVAATREALSRAARGEGPTLIEAITYRLSGHSTSDDPKAYRQEDEVEEWRRRDPIARTRRLLNARGLWTDADQTRTESAMVEEIKQAVLVAEKAPPPALSTMFEDVYAEMPWHLTEQCEYLLRAPRPTSHK